MPDVAAFPPNYFGNFFLVLVRVGAMLFTAPLLQGRVVPAMLKVGLALLISFLLVPINQGHFIEVPFAWVPLTILVLKETGVGVLVGFIANLVFAAMQVAGQFIGLQAGFSLANVIDPLFSQSISILDQLYTIVAGLVFLSIDGQQMLILAVQQTFDVVPLGTFSLGEPLFNQLARLTVGVFVAGVRIALPVMASLLLADISLGLMARSFPQLNIFVVGLPVKLFLAFLVIIATLPAVQSLTQSMFQSSFVDLSNLLRLAPNAQ